MYLPVPTTRRTDRLGSRWVFIYVYLMCGIQRTSRIKTNVFRFDCDVQVHFDFLFLSAAVLLFLSNCLRHGIGSFHPRYDVFLILKDLCRFLTDFAQLYRLHWAFRKKIKWTRHWTPCSKCPLRKSGKTSTHPKHGG